MQETVASDLAVRKELLQRLDADPQGYHANLDMGFYCAERRDLFYQAEPYLSKALSFGQIDDKTPHLLSTLGEILFRRGEIEGSIAIFRLLTQQFPDPINYRFLLGDALFYGGHHQEAFPVYGKAIDMLDANALAVSAEIGEPAPRILSPATTLYEHIGELAHSLDMHLKARALGFIPDFPALLMAPRDGVANMALVDCLPNHVRVETDREAVERAYEKFGGCPYYVNYVPLPDGRVLPRDAAYGMIQSQWSAQKRPPVIRPTGRILELGQARLTEMGIPEGAWFVALHVREEGFFGERMPWDNNQLRNCRVEDYLPAVEAITERGGWVVRMGDPTMTPLPEMPRVIDYAVSRWRADWMDVFCFSQCRFFLGSASGPMNVARLFGVPVVATNFFPVGTWPFSMGDVFTFKTVRKKAGGRLLSLAEAMKPPLFAAWNPLVYDSLGVEVIDNTADDTLGAVNEMFEILDDARTSTAEERQRLEAFRKAGDPMGSGLVLPISRAFLERHPGLCPENA
ncbi:MAG: TIGR04372 family glycosyltransferase [Rhodospirillales bacterium]|nr:TIGR04372 family glycosyltransferase [Rhodospirillales bacterium]